MDGDVSSFAGAFVDDAMVGIYSPSAVAFNGGVQRDSFAVAFETPVVNGDQHGAVTGSQFVGMTDLESRPFMPVAGLVATEAVQEWRSGVINIDTGNSSSTSPSVWQGGNVLVPPVQVGEIGVGAGEQPFWRAWGSRGRERQMQRPTECARHLAPRPAQSEPQTEVVGG